MSQLPAEVSSLVNNLEATTSVEPTVSDTDFLYLKMTKQGEWVYGAEDTPVSKDSFFIIDPASYAQGFIAWDDGDFVDEVMAVTGQPAITTDQLPTISRGKWDAQKSIALKGLEGGDNGVQLIYKVSNRGGKAALEKLIMQVIARGKAGEVDLCPVVSLDSSSYKHKKYGKIYTPVIEVDEWVSAPPIGAEPAAPAEPAAIAEPVEPAEPAEPAPRKRRRTRAA